MEVDDFLPLSPQQLRGDIYPVHVFAFISFAKRPTTALQEAIYSLTAPLKRQKGGQQKLVAEGYPKKIGGLVWLEDDFSDFNWVIFLRTMLIFRVVGTISYPVS